MFISFLYSLAVILYMGSEYIFLFPTPAHPKGFPAFEKKCRIF